MTAKYQIYKDVAGKFRFRLLAENNRIVAVGEAYEQHSSCLIGVKSVMKNYGSDVEDTTVEGKKIPNPKYQVFKDKAGEFRFHLKASNGETIATSEGYETKESCLDGINAVKRIGNAEIQDLTVNDKPIKEDSSSKEIEASTVSPILSKEKIEVPLPVAKTEVPQATTVSPVEPEAPKSNQTVKTKPTGISALKGHLIAIIGIVIALTLIALALSIGNGSDFFGISGDMAKATALIGAALIFCLTIALFAKKKYF